MTIRKVALADLPFWPLFLSREEAARYVGVSPTVFDEEVAAGLWPAPRLRGGKGSRRTWLRTALDDAAVPRPETAGPPAQPPAAEPAIDFGSRFRDGQTKSNTRQARQTSAA